MPKPYLEVFRCNALVLTAGRQTGRSGHRISDQSIYAWRKQEPIDTDSSLDHLGKQSKPGSRAHTPSELATQVRGHSDDGLADSPGSRRRLLRSPKPSMRSGLLRLIEQLRGVHATSAAPTGRAPRAHRVHLGLSIVAGHGQIELIYGVCRHQRSVGDEAAPS
ncbi:hypothetical protein RW1_022_01020 [Rhodococcus wratislaviensis NBRC 100605]|uniref:Uncharacterized protein n=1 Tax=Rhodococcus wratislaviensis NBRC 100605 TaxID=1219028 RepID=X0Q3A3_RHOWR|nr:hypothetical protein RW1_022_01020 [Rhodococcus wratislaviensis NBRC 100605]